MDDSKGNPRKKVKADEYSTSTKKCWVCGKTKSSRVMIFWCSKHHLKDVDYDGYFLTILNSPVPDCTGDLRCRARYTICHPCKVAIEALSNRISLVRDCYPELYQAWTFNIKPSHLREEPDETDYPVATTNPSSSTLLPSTSTPLRAAEKTTEQQMGMTSDNLFGKSLGLSVSDINNDPLLSSRLAQTYKSSLITAFNTETTDDIAKSMLPAETSNIETNEFVVNRQIESQHQPRPSSADQTLSVEPSVMSGSIGTCKGVCATDTRHDARMGHQWNRSDSIPSSHTTLKEYDMNSNTKSMNPSSSIMYSINHVQCQDDDKDNAMTTYPSHTIQGSDSQQLSQYRYYTSTYEQHLPSSVQNLSEAERTYHESIPKIDQQVQRFTPLGNVDSRTSDTRDLQSTQRLVTSSQFSSHQHPKHVSTAESSSQCTASLISSVELQTETELNSWSGQQEQEHAAQSMASSLPGITTSNMETIQSSIRLSSPLSQTLHRTATNSMERRGDYRIQQPPTVTSYSTSSNPLKRAPMGELRHGSVAIKESQQSHGSQQHLSEDFRDRKQFAHDNHALPSNTRANKFQVTVSTYSGTKNPTISCYSNTSKSLEKPLPLLNIVTGSNVNTSEETQQERLFPIYTMYPSLPATINSEQTNFGNAYCSKSQVQDGRNLLSDDTPLVGLWVTYDPTLGYAKPISLAMCDIKKSGDSEVQYHTTHLSRDQLKPYHHIAREDNCKQERSYVAKYQRQIDQPQQIQVQQPLPDGNSSSFERSVYTEETRQPSNKIPQAKHADMTTTSSVDHHTELSKDQHHQDVLNNERVKPRTELSHSKRKSDPSRHSSSVQNLTLSESQLEKKTNSSQYEETCNDSQIKDYSRRQERHRPEITEQSLNRKIQESISNLHSSKTALDQTPSSSSQQCLPLLMSPMQKETSTSMAYESDEFVGRDAACTTSPSDGTQSRSQSSSTNISPSTTAPYTSTPERVGLIATPSSTRSAAVPISPLSSKLADRHSDIAKDMFQADGEEASETSLQKTEEQLPTTTQQQQSSEAQPSIGRIEEASTMQQEIAALFLEGKFKEALRRSREVMLQLLLITIKCSYTLAY